MLRARQRRMICVICKNPFAEGERGHDQDCPILALPQIVAALEAAERVVDDPMGTPEHGDYGTCWFCDQGEPQKRLLADAGHADACPWQALVAALAGEQVTRS